MIPRPRSIRFVPPSLTLLAFLAIAQSSAALPGKGIDFLGALVVEHEIDWAGHVFERLAFKMDRRKAFRHCREERFFPQRAPSQNGSIDIE